MDRVGRVAGDDGMAWDVYLKRPGRPRVRVAWPDGMPESRHLFGGREAVVGQSRYGDLVIAERTPRPVIDEHEWQPDGRLVLRGSFLGAGLPGAGSSGGGDRYETVLRRIGSADSHVIGFQVEGERFSIEADLDRMPFFGSAIPLRDGEWNLYVRPAGAGSEALAELKYDHDRLGDVTGQRVAAGRKWYRLMVTGHDDPLITAEPQLRRVEQGNFGQRALRRGFYPAMLRSAPVRDSVFFVSWKGKQCGDNPLGIAEELRRRGDDREHLWAVTDWSVPVPEGGTGVLRGTQEYYEALARSRYLISNDDMQAPFRKRDGQIYLQTWHGTPLKRIGFDISNPQFISGTAYFDHLARDVAQWDLLLSPNPFSTPIMRRAFRYDGEICEYGYPRNDLLCRADARGGGRAGPGPARAARRESGSCSTRPPGGTTRCTRTAAGTGSTCAWTWSGPGGNSARTTCSSSAGTTTWRTTCPPGCGPASRSTSPPTPISPSSSWCPTSWSPTTPRPCSTTRSPAGRCCSSPMTWPNTATACAASTSTSRRRPPARCWPARPR